VVGVRAAPPVDFSLALGGPLFQRLLRWRGIHASSSEVSLRRMIAVPILAWLPLVIFAMCAGSGGRELPFFADLDAHTRLLGTLPLLLGTEILVHRRIRSVVARFVEDGIVPAAEMPRFDAILAGAMRWRNSLAAEAVLLVLAWTVGHWLWSTQLRFDAVTWYATPASGTAKLTTAGTWYAFVSLPILRFLLFRWYYRLGIWCAVAWRVSRLPLQVCPLHPDRAGGLGFVTQSVHAFTPFALAHTVPLAGMLATRILHGGAQLVQFRGEIAVTVALLLAIVFLPTLFFRGTLAAARSRSVRENGAVVAQVAASLRGKSFDARAADAGRELVWLADLDRVNAAAERMRTFVLKRGDVVGTAAILLLPLAPLSLTMFPFEEILRRVVDVVF